MKTTKNFATIFCITLAVLMTSFGNINAQNGQRAEKAKARIEKMKTDLNLSDTQVASIQSILKDSKSERKEARQNKDREEMKEHAKETQDKIMTVLNSEQQAKFKEMANNRKTKKKTR
jgi:septal ring factor EnvC (AmiA/AmiB activator)